MWNWLVTVQEHKGTFQGIRNILPIDTGRGYKGLKGLKLYMCKMNRSCGFMYVNPQFKRSVEGLGTCLSQ